MQTKAIINAAIEVNKEGLNVEPEIMIPLVGALNEFRNIKIQENVDIEIIDKLMSKLLKAPVNKKMLSLNRTAKGKFTSNEAR